VLSASIEHISEHNTIENRYQPVNVNMVALESRVQRVREYIPLSGYMGAEMRGELTEDRVQDLRQATLTVVDSIHEGGAQIETRPTLAKT
jgi:hypothetical protein